MLREAYMLVAINLKRVIYKQPTKKTKDPSKLKVGDLILLKNHKKETWDTKYMPNFYVCKMINDKAYDLQDKTCHVRLASVADIHLLMPAEYIISMLPDIKAFRWACKYTNDPSFMHNLYWQKSSVYKSIDKNVDENVNTTKHKYSL